MNRAPVIVYGRYCRGELLPIEHRVMVLPESSETAKRTLECRPQFPFMPFTLLAWGAHADTFISAVFIQEENQLLTRVPGCLFECELDWQEFQTLWQKRNGAIALDDSGLDTLGHFFRFDMPAVGAGELIQIELEGRLDHLVLLGRAPSGESQ